MSELYEVRRYCKEYADAWDKFLQEDAVNGTFLQSRRFLSYHPKERFTDHSYIVYDSKGNIAALCPACERETENRLLLDSHTGKVLNYGLTASKEAYGAKHDVNRIYSKVLKGTNE